MAKINEYSVTWTQSTAVDVVGYKIYYVPEGEELNYGSPSVTVGNVSSITIPADVPEFPMIDGSYNIGLVSLDDSGNESDMLSKIVPFDLTAPDAPLDLNVVAL